MIRAALDDVQTILCIGAHADDIEIGCGGTLLKWLEERPDRCVTWVVLSAPGERAKEARDAAAKILNGTSSSDVVIGSFTNSYFPSQYAEIKSFVHELAARIDPDVIFAPGLEDRHQDHRLVAEMSWNAFRDHLIFEYEIPKYEGDLGRPNVYVPLTEAQAEAKVNTILDMFPSQADKLWLSAENLRALLRIRGIESNAPEGLAEGLTCRKLSI